MENTFIPLSIGSVKPILRILNLLLCVLIGVAVAQTVWLLWPGESDLTTTAPANTTSQGPATTPAANIDSILNAQLFGKRQNTAPVQIDPLVAPETNLNLKLTGIFSATDPNQSRALIKDGSGKQRAYGIGDDIPGRAKLYSIHSDRVLLERNGRYETLRLEQDKLSGPAQQSQINRFQSTGTPTASNLSGEALLQLSEIRAQLLQDPTKAGQYIRVQPVYNQGQLKGYRVYPGKNRQLFKDVGLRAGEMVTNINGTQLDDPAKALEMISELSSSTQLSVTLERAGQSRTVNINLNQ